MRARWAIALALSLALAGVAEAYSPTVERTVLVLIRALAYDRALGARVGGGVRLGVAYAEGDAASRDEATDIAEVVGGLAGTTVSGVPLEPAVVIAVGATPPDLGAVNGGLLLCHGLSPDQLTAVSTVTRERDVPTLAMDAAYVGRGATVGAEQRAARLQLLVDRSSAQQEGADFSAALLDLARILEAPQ